MDSIGSSVFVIGSPTVNTPIMENVAQDTSPNTTFSQYQAQTEDPLRSPRLNERRNMRRFSADQGKVAYLAQKFNFNSNDPSLQRKVEDWFSRTDASSVRSVRTNSRPPSPRLPRDSEYRRSMSAFGYEGQQCITPRARSISAYNGYEGLGKSSSTPALNCMGEHDINRIKSLSDPLSVEETGFPVIQNRSSLSPMDEIHIKKLIGDQRLALQLIYQASLHGYDPKVFHAKCDRIGPTLVLVTTKPGVRFGVYTSVGWCSRGAGVNDKKSFFFRVKQGYSGEHGDKIKLIATQNDTDLHIHDDPNLGPFFGSLEKPTLRLFCSVFQAKSAKVYEEGPFAGASLLDIFGVEEGSLELEEVEVFNASARVPPILDRPWRDVEFSTESLISLILFHTSFKPSFCSLEQVNILLLGATGSGKSSVFNTVESTFKQHVTFRARTGSASKNQFRRYTIQHPRGHLPLHLCDTPGISEILFTPSDLVYILDGHLPDRFTFPVAGKITNRSQGFSSETTLRDEMHCVVFVIDVTNIPQPGTTLYTKILEMKTEINARDIPIRVLLTKVDLACSIVANNLRLVYRSCHITEKIEKISELFTIPRSNIFPMKCYEHEIKLVESVGLLALSALQNAIYAAESSLEDRESMHGPTIYIRKGRSASSVSGGSGPTSYPRNRSLEENKERTLSDLLYGSPRSAPTSKSPPSTDGKHSQSAPTSKSPPQSNEKSMDSSGLISEINEEIDFHS